MKPTKVFVRVKDSTTKEEVKHVADLLAEDNSTYNCKVYTFVTDVKRVYVATSDEDYVRDEDLNKYPLARNQADIVKTYEIYYTEDSSIASFTDAIDVCTAVLDQYVTGANQITIIKLIDLKDSNYSRLVLPSMFKNSKYKDSVKCVEIGDAVNGADIMPDSLNITSFLEDGATI